MNSSVVLFGCLAFCNVFLFTVGERHPFEANGENTTDRNARNGTEARNTTQPYHPAHPDEEDPHDPHAAGEGRPPETGMWWMVEAFSQGMAEGYSRIEQALAREGKDTIAQELRSAFYVDASNLNVSCMEQALSFVAAVSTIPTMTLDESVQLLVTYLPYLEVVYLFAMGYSAMSVLVTFTDRLVHLVQALVACLVLSAAASASLVGVGLDVCWRIGTFMLGNVI